VNVPVIAAAFWLVMSYWKLPHEAGVGIEFDVHAPTSDGPDAVFVPAALLFAVLSSAVGTSTDEEWSKPHPLASTAAVASATKPPRIRILQTCLSLHGFRSVLDWKTVDFFE
jgi:hypothetical protein